MKRLLFFALLSVNSAAFGQTLIITQLCELPSEVIETSGLENGPDDCFWTHNDSGNPSVLYCLDTTGVIQRTVTVVGDANTDWEDLAKDNLGNMYIGNFGNNSLNRTDLRIVKVPSIDTCTATTYVTDTINFSYPDQLNFPPSGSYGNFDMEAFFWYQDSLHLFSKDRSNPSTGYTKHYTLPTYGGTYTANLIDSLETGGTSFIYSVTSADISEDGQSIALLNSDRIWLCTNYLGTNFFGGQVSELLLGDFSQKEGICFKNGFLYVTDEESFGLGGKMHRINPVLFVSAANALVDFDLQPVYNSKLHLTEIKLAENQPVEWHLYTKAGKLVQTGNSTNRIPASEFQVSKGVFVLRVSSEGLQKALLIKL